ALNSALKRLLVFPIGVILSLFFLNLDHTLSFVHYCPFFRVHCRAIIHEHGWSGLWMLIIILPVILLGLSLLGRKMLGWNGYKYKRHEPDVRIRTEDIEKYEEEKEKEDKRRFWWIIILLVVIPILLATLETCNPNKHSADDDDANRDIDETPFIRP
ncbi:MAG: hypothetical protein WAX69_26690, partial [Victivallales bacterium]